MKTLILLFNNCIFDIDEVNDFSDLVAYSNAKQGVNNATCDIYTSEDFFKTWNTTPNDLDGWIAKPVQVDDAEYNVWWK